MQFETDTHYINCNSITAIGSKVLLKKLVKTLDKKYGDIIIPHTKDKNQSMGVAEVVNLGRKAKKDTNLSPGDFVLYDYYSVYGNNDVYVITNAENIIFSLTKDEADEYVNNYIIK